MGKYPVADSTQLRSALKLADGIVSSGDALDCSIEDQEYMAPYGGSLKEMEAAAIGWVCQKTKTIFLPIKAITDWVDHPADTALQFNENYAHSISNLTEVTLSVIKYLSEHPEDPMWS